MSFTPRHFLQILVSLLTVVLAISCSPTPPVKAQDLSLQGFPTSEFFGGLSVGLDGLQNHPRYQLLPLDELIPASTSFDYLDNELISQFAIFLKESNESNCGSHQQFEIAAVGKLRDPDTFDVRKELSRWKNRTTPRREDTACEVKEIEVGDKTCYQFQTGTVFNSIQRQGKVEFYDEDGKKMERGINVGNLTDRGYTAERKDSKAVVSLAGLRSADLIEENLVLDFFLDVFEVQRQNKEWREARVYLQTSDDKLRSSFVEIKARSFANHRLQFPRELSVFDTESGEAQGSIDLIDDFASDGEFQVVLQSLERTTYIGLKDSDVGILLPRYEYLGTNGGFVIVAQSMKSLKQMLALSPQQMAEKFALSEGQQVSASFDLSSNEKLNSFKQFLTLLDMQHAIHALPPSTKNVRLSIEMDRDRIFSASIGMSVHDSKTQSKQIAESIEKKTSPSNFPTAFFEFVVRQDTMATLRTMSFSMADGWQNIVPWASAKSDTIVFPNSSFDRRSMRPFFQKLFEDLASGVQVRDLSGDLAIEFNWPFKDPSELSKTDRLLLALLRRYRACDHYQQKRFFLGEQIERRLMDEFPEEDGLWLSLSHQLSYNISIEFGTGATSYAWVRRGINVLLDAAELHEHSVDAIWMVATFIGWKSESPYGGVEFRRLFTDDRELLDRIGKHVDLKKCLDEDGQIDCLLIARRIFERCNQRVDGNERVKLNIEKLDRMALPIGMLERRARRLEREFQIQAADQHWQQALVEWQQLGEQVVEFDSGAKLKLNQLEAKDDQPVDRDNYDVVESRAYWYQTRIKAIQFKLSIDASAVTQHIANANVLRENGDLDSALVQAKLALQIIRQIMKRAPENRLSVNWFFNDFLSDAERQYKQLDEPFAEEVNEFRKKFGFDQPMMWVR